MSEIIIKKDEPFESALRRFKKKIDKEGILRELRDRKHYEKPSERKRKKPRRQDNALPNQLLQITQCIKGGVGETVPHDWGCSAEPTISRRSAEGGLPPSGRCEVNFRNY